MIFLSNVPKTASLLLAQAAAGMRSFARFSPLNIPMANTAYTARACLKIAFCKIPSQFASDFMLDLGGVVGYIDEIQHRIRCKLGRKIVGMNFQTRSSTANNKFLIH